MSVTPTVGIALGGGGAKGLAHALMLEALDELGVRPVRIAGSSIGAVIGWLYAAGRSGREIRDQFQTLLVPRNESVEEWLRTKVSTFLRVLEVDFSGGGLLSPQRFLEQLASHANVDQFEQLAIPLSVVAADFWRREEVVFERGPVLSAVDASIALPGIFEPVVDGERVLVDGGVVNPVPYDLLRGRCDVVVAVNVMGQREPDEDLLPSFTEAVFNTFQIMQRAILDNKRRLDPPDIYVEPEIRGVRVLEFGKAAEVFAQAEPAKDELKRALAARLDR